MHTVVSALTHFAGLLTLKNKPQDLLCSKNMLIILFVLLFLIFKLTVKRSIPELAKITALIPIFVVIYEGLFLTVLFSMLNKSGKKNRFVQSACNFIGVHITSCLISPIIALLPFPLFFLCLAKSWLLLVNFNITKHTFDIDQIKAVWTYLLINTIAIITMAIPCMILGALYGGVK